MELFKDLDEEVRRQRLRVHNVVVRQGGEIIGRRDFIPEAPHLLWSGSKTFTSMAVGIAAGDGKFSLTDPMTKFFREMGYDPDPGFDAITVRDLLRMGTGHARCPVYHQMDRGLPLGDVCARFFEEPLIYKPGEKFAYNNAATYMLSRIVEHTTGENLRDYLVPRLFEPLGIAPPRWDCCPNGHSQGFSGLWLTAEELSRLGQLLLDGGRYGGRQLVPADYVKAAMTVQIGTSDFDADFVTADYQQGYGYQMWQNSYLGSWRLDGMYGQFSIILPDRDAVVTYTANESRHTAGVMELTWSTLLDKLPLVQQGEHI